MRLNLPMPMPSMSRIADWSWDAVLRLELLRPDKILCETRKRPHYSNNGYRSGLKAAGFRKSEVSKVLGLSPYGYPCPCPCPCPSRRRRVSVSKSRSNLAGANAKQAKGRNRSGSAQGLQGIATPHFVTPYKCKKSSRRTNCRTFEVK